MGQPGVKISSRYGFPGLIDDIGDQTK